MWGVNHTEMYSHTLTCYWKQLIGTKVFQESCPSEGEKHYLFEQRQEWKLMRVFLLYMLMQPKLNLGYYACGSSTTCWDIFQFQSVACHFARIVLLLSNGKAVALWVLWCLCAWGHGRALFIKTIIWGTACFCIHSHNNNDHSLSATEFLARSTRYSLLHIRSTYSR